MGGSDKAWPFDAAAASKGRWTVVSGSAQFLEMASVLVMAGCKGKVDWEPDGTHLAQLLARQDEHAVNVLVGEGVTGMSAQQAAVAAASCGATMTILCTPSAPNIVDRLMEQGVDVVVTPKGLLRVLMSLCGREPELAPIAGATKSRGPAAARRPQAPGPQPQGRQAAAEPQQRSKRGQSSTAPAPAQAAARPKAGASAADVPALRALGTVSRGSTGADARAAAACAAGKDGRTSVPTICLASARGGVGRSAIATLLATIMARSGLRVCLVDLDLQFGTCAAMLGASEADGLCPDEAAPGSLRVDADAVARCRTLVEERLSVFEFCKMPEHAEVIAARSADLLQMARGSAQVAVVDLPSGMSEGAAQVFDLSDRCLLVADQEALSLESLAGMVSLCSRVGVPSTKLVGVINRCDPRHRDEGFLTRAGFEVQVPRLMRVQDGGAEVRRLLAIGHAGELLGLRNRMVGDLVDIARDLCSDLGCLPGEGLLHEEGSQARRQTQPRRRQKEARGSQCR